MGTSPNFTVIVAGNGGVITDAAGNAWTITASGQVAVNGDAELSTVGVVELAFVNGVMWLRNKWGNWQGKAAPSAPWLPAVGTPVSPLPVTVATVQAQLAQVSAVLAAISADVGML